MALTITEKPPAPSQLALVWGCYRTPQSTPVVSKLSQIAIFRVSIRPFGYQPIELDGRGERIGRQTSCPPPYGRTRDARSSKSSVVPICEPLFGSISTDRRPGKKIASPQQVREAIFFLVDVVGARGLDSSLRDSPSLRSGALRASVAGLRPARKNLRSVPSHRHTISN